MARILRCCLLLSIVILTGCRAAPPSVSLTDAINAIAVDLGKFHSISLHDVPTWDTVRLTSFISSLKKAQCYQKTNDPVMSFLDDKVQINLEGSYTTSGSFAVGSVTTTPALSFSGSSAKTMDQKLVVPVSFVPLSQMADKLYLQQLGDRQGLLSVSTTSEKQEIITGLSMDRDSLKAIISQVISSYDTDLCDQTKTDSHQSVMFGAKAPNHSKP